MSGMGKDECIAVTYRGYNNTLDSSDNFRLVLGLFGVKFIDISSTYKLVDIKAISQV